MSLLAWLHFVRVLSTLCNLFVFYVCSVIQTSSSHELFFLDTENKQLSGICSLSLLCMTQTPMFVLVGACLFYVMLSSTFVDGMWV